jgi:hypothetical protein
MAARDNPKAASVLNRDDLITVARLKHVTL